MADKAPSEYLTKHSNTYWAVDLRLLRSDKWGKLDRDLKLHYLLMLSLVDTAGNVLYDQRQIAIDLYRDEVLDGKLTPGTIQGWTKSLISVDLFEVYEVNKGNNGEVGKIVLLHATGYIRPHQRGRLTLPSLPLHPIQPKEQFRDSYWAKSLATTIDEYQVIDRKGKGEGQRKREREEKKKREKKKSSEFLQASTQAESSSITDLDTLVSLIQSTLADHSYHPRGLLDLLDQIADCYPDDYQAIRDDVLPRYTGRTLEQLDTDKLACQQDLDRMSAGQGDDVLASNRAAWGDIMSQYGDKVSPTE